MDMRLCHPSDLDTYFYVRNAGKCLFGGQVSDLVNDALQPFLRKFNLTCRIDADNGFGQVTDSSGAYDGCLGRLQRNQSDIILRFGDYPMDVSHVSQGLVLFDTKITISQHSYHPNKTHALQVLSSLTRNINILPYLVCFFLAVVLTLKLSAYLKMDYRKCLCKIPQTQFSRLPVRPPCTPRNDFVCKVMAHAFRLGSLTCGEYLHGRIIFINLSMFSVLILIFLYSTIETNLIVTEKPQLWHSYQDIIDAGVNVHFVDQFDTTIYFKNAPHDSPENKLWRHVKGQQNLLVPAGMQAFVRIGSRMLSRKSAFLLDDLSANGIRNSGCMFRRYQMMPQMMSINSTEYEQDLKWRVSSYFYAIKHDPAAPTIERGALVSQFFDSLAAKLIIHQTRVHFERGLVHKNMEQLKSFNFAAPLLKLLPLRPDASADDMRECISNEKHRCDEKPHVLLARNTVSLLQTCAILLAVAYIVLQWENNSACHRKKTRTLARRRKRVHRY